MQARTFEKFSASIPKAIVAVIDDDPGMRRAMARVLSAHGYGTETFDSAEAFLDTAGASEAACLLVDIHLGDTSGLELARKLTAAGIRYPIIFMSGCGDDQIRAQAAVVGGVAFLNKPFPKELLIASIIKATG